MSKVETDMDEHTVTVTFDDGATSVDDVVAALSDAGYVAKSPRKLP